MGGRLHSLTRARLLPVRQLRNRIEEAQGVLDCADSAESVDGFQAGHYEGCLDVLRWCALYVALCSSCLA